MIEIALLTCLEAQKLITNITKGDLPILIKVELIQEVLDRSDCKNGNVWRHKVLL